MFALVFCLPLSPVHAYEAEFSVEKEKISEFSINNKEITLNNIAFKVNKVAFVYGAHAGVLALSMRNNAKVPIAATAMFIGYDENEKILWATSVGTPPFNLDVGTVRTYKSNFSITKGQLEETKRIWIKVVGSF